jgi:DNA repair exonuclease SbcCD ATPase subunit
MGFWDKAFSEKGLVKFVIRTIKDYLNTQCSFYLGYLTNGNISVEFDEELKEKIEVGGSLRHYISLSGGEKRKLNLAVMLGLQSLLTMSNGHKSNLLFFDEVAENLDENGVIGLYNLLCELKKDKTIFIITHNQVLKSLLDSSKTLMVVKEEGESKII